MKIKLVLADLDRAYTGRFVKCIQCHYFDRLDVAVCSSQESLDEKVNKEHVDVVMYAEPFVVDESRYHCLKLVSESGVTAVDGKPVCCKYQKLEHIYKQILSVYAESDKVYDYQMQTDARGCRITCFTSAQGGAGKTTCAVGYARMLARQGRKVIYVSTQALQDGSLYFPDQQGGSLSQVFFSIKRSKGNVALKIESSILCDEYGVSYFLPVDNPMEMIEITAQEWQVLVETIRSLGTFDDVIIEVGNPLYDNVSALLKESHRLVLVEDAGGVGTKRVEDLVKAFQIIQNKQNIDVLSRMCVLVNRLQYGENVPQTECGLPVTGGILALEGKVRGSFLVQNLIDRNMAPGLQNMMEQEGGRA